MRAIRNLTWFLLAFGLTVWAGLASAQSDLDAERVYYSATHLGKTGFGKTNAESCQVMYSKITTVSFTYAGALAGSGASGGCQATWTNDPVVKTYGTWTRMLCAIGKKWGGSGCVDRNTPDPDPPASCKAGELGSYTWKFEYDSFGGKPNDGACDLNCTEVKECFSRPNSADPNQVYCTYTCSKTGNAKSSGNGVDTVSENARGPGDKRGDVPPIDATDGTCPKGTVNVGTNSDGVPRCQGTGTNPSNKPPVPPKVETEKTETAEDGTKTTTKTEVTTNSDGSKTTTTTVTITKPDGTKQVDQTKDTSNTPSNSPGKDDSAKDDEKYDLCKQNPHLTICRNSSVAGKCGEISCEGDAIQCATLRAAAAMRCEQQTDQEALKASPLTAIGQAAINGTGLDSLPGPGNSQIVNLPSLEAQGWLGNGAAFADVTVTIQGQEVLVPLSKWSEYLLPFRFIMMIIASLISYRILSGAVIGS